ncbi:MAG: lysylphosphatidylglycerol synthase transmembrane domain-containing protein [Pseudomonadota bacterium]
MKQAVHSLNPAAQRQHAVPTQAPRRLLPLAVKLALALALFLWMMSTGKLELAQLRVFATDLPLTLGACAFWLAGPVLLASLRWKLLLTAAGYRIGMARSVLLQLIGFFFTTVMPGSLGGDFIKVYYLIKDNPGKGKSTALWAILLDRLIGMLGLFLVGAVFITPKLDALWQIVLLRPVIALVYGYIVLCAVLMAALKLLKAPAGAAHADGDSLPARLRAGFLACRVYRDRSRTLVLATLLSTLSQGLSFLFFVALTARLTGAGAAWHALGAIFPLGMAITTLPLSPGGLGVGHLAFDQLFTLVHLSGGANVYNAYFVSQTLLNLTGVVAYLLNRPAGLAAPHAARTAH